MHRIAADRVLLVALGLVAAPAYTACGDETRVPQAEARECLAGGLLHGAIYGGIRGTLDWRGAELHCSGMPRPNGQGARLHFSGTLEIGDGERTLAFIIGLPELGRGDTVRETPAIVTLIEEDSGRFFSTADADICWSDVVLQTPIDGDVYAVRGIVYCVSPLAELGGSGDVSFTELEYSGRLDWAGTE